MGEISVTKLLVIGVLIVLIFGTKKLRSLGGDLGSAVKGFKKAMSDEESSATNTTTAEKNDATSTPNDRLSHKE